MLCGGRWRSLQRSGKDATTGIAMAASTDCLSLRYFEVLRCHVEASDGTTVCIPCSISLVSLAIHDYGLCVIQVLSGQSRFAILRHCFLCGGQRFVSRRVLVCPRW